MPTLASSLLECVKPIAKEVWQLSGQPPRLGRALWSDLDMPQAFLTLPWHFRVDPFSGFPRPSAVQLAAVGDLTALRESKRPWAVNEPDVFGRGAAAVAALRGDDAMVMAERANVRAPAESCQDVGSFKLTEA